MSKLIGFTAFAVVATAAVAIASLVLNIIILTNTNTIVPNTNNILGQISPPVADNNGVKPCAAMGSVSNKSGWAAAANYLLSGMDESIDPCEDFYAFSCNKFLGSIKLDPSQGINRVGTYDNAQVLVNKAIAAALANVKVTDSLTERITKQALDSCVYNSNNGGGDFTQGIITEINEWFGGAPFLGQPLKDKIDLFGIAGILEQTHALGTIMSSWTSVDYQQVQNNALYVSQPSLDMPRDYFVLPQFIDKLTGEMEGILGVMQAYNLASGGGANDTQLRAAAQDVVNFEVQIALASWPDDLMRNYKLQYNRYLLAELSTTYPNINFTSYLNNLLNGIQDSTGVATDGVVLSQPSYFAWLNSVFQGNTVNPNTVANYMIVQLLMDDGGFWGPASQRVVREKDHVPYAMRRGRGVTRIGRRDHRKFDQEGPEIGCIDLLMAYMPYGPGYVYVKTQQNRADVITDVKHQTKLIIQNFQGMIDTLTWMSDGTKALAKNKSDSLLQNYGYPDMFGDFKDTTTIDNYHQDYKSILDLKIPDFYDILKVLKKGMEVREAFRLLTPDGNAPWGNNLRANFLQSPAMVNAWYQPERNSITFPYATWNPPYYNIGYPQAYNYAGQGGTGGHELTHGFDDEGVQFDWDGSMTECTWNKCGWMDSNSSTGFNTMAQCVVSQYSTQCCPLKTGNVHCANGATTQGENIADLGGQQAAYNAYQDYIKEQKGVEEARLPGMSRYSPNQIFWITYAYGWCMKQTDANLVNSLLTNPHAPGSCRTNQVMQDIPSFGKDFNCKQGQPMYPMDDQRCKVWVGY